MTLRRIDPALYATAADSFDAVSNSADRFLASARSALGAYSRMAGDDPGGEQFATNYDTLAAAALQSFADIAVRATMIDRALMASGAGHADADGALAGRPGAASAFPLRPAQVPICVSPPPSAFGGDSGSTPGPWELVKDLVGMMWPNADVAKLKRAATTWQTISDDFTALARQISQSDDAVAGLSSAELARVGVEVADFSSDVRETAEHVAEIASMCSEYATAVEEAHNEVIDMLTQLVIELAATAGVSFALSFVTFGGAGAIGAGAAALRIANVAYRVGAAIARVSGIAGRIAARLILLYSRFVAFAGRHAKAATMIIEVVSGGSGAAISERIVRGARGNPLAAFGSGIVGGTVALRVTARFSGLGSAVVREALAEGAGGAASGIASGVISGSGIDPRNVLINGAGGALFGGAFARVGRRTQTPGSAPDGAPVHLPDHDAPDIAGSDRPSIGAGDGPASRPDYDGPHAGTADVVGSHVDAGAAARIPDGDAPIATDIDVAPPAHGGGDAPAAHGGEDAPPAHGGGDAPAAHGGESPQSTRAGDAPASHGSLDELRTQIDEIDANADHGFDDPIDDIRSDADQPVSHDDAAADPQDLAAHPDGAASGHEESVAGSPDPGAQPGHVVDPSELQTLTSHQQEIVAGTDRSGDGWFRVEHTDHDATSRLKAEIAEYNYPKNEFGALPAERGADVVAQPPGRAANLLHYDSSQPYGHALYDPARPALTASEFDGHYVRPGDSLHFSPNEGAVLGTRVQYTDLDKYLRDFGNLRIDRLGGDGGSFLGLGGGTFEDRALPPSQRGTDLLRDFAFTPGSSLPDGWKIEIGFIAEAYGRDGGGLQLVVRDQLGDDVKLYELLRKGILAEVRQW